ncbi:RES domain-containing protein [Desulfotomaculum arcticum]|uniref:RES domain-containing protein n=2 Tax=Desulfotruncus TaxID=2867377 RepID=A0A1I2MXB0_9FIRM|nr:RES domain-containing protein [Desulfotomaculum arcticum] [Desulfotruncus arcticus DSM 17038]
MNNGYQDLSCSAYTTNNNHTREKYTEFAEHIKVHGLKVDSYFMDNNIFIKNFLNGIDEIIINEQEKLIRIVRWDVGMKGENFAPDPARTKAGRLNPEKVAYLYLGNNEITAMKETRIKKRESFYIGTFRSRTNLKILDFSSDREAERSKVNSYKLIIDEEFSKPLKDSDEKKEYLPTQFIAKLIKDKGYDGVKYSSALCESGYNICIFEANNMECVHFEYR